MYNVQLINMSCMYTHMYIVCIGIVSASGLQVKCFHCTGMTRHLRADGSIAYKNGDRTMTPAVKSECGCGYRHYWDGEEYDNLPERCVELSRDSHMTVTCQSSFFPPGFH